MGEGNVDGGQCDQIGRFLKVLGNILPFKSCPNILWRLGLFWKTYFWAVFEKVWTVFRSNIWSHWLWKLNCQCGEMTYYLFQQLGLLRRGLQDSLRRGWDGPQVLRGGDDRAAEHRVQGPVLQNHFLPYQDECNQSDLIGQFIELWPTFQSLWQQRICPILLHF